MIAFIIIGVVLLLILGILFLPLCVSVDFKKEFYVKIFFFFVKIYEIKPQESKKGESKKTTKKKEPSLFEKFSAKYGFTGAVKEFFAFLKSVFTHTKKFLRHIKFDKVKIFIKVATNDAAQTAIEYGEVCGAVYSVLSEISALEKIKYKKIDISSDFESGVSEFDFSLKIRLCIFHCLIAAYKLYKEYKNFTARIETDE